MTNIGSEATPTEVKKEEPSEPEIRYPKRAEMPKTGTTKAEEETDDWAAIPAFLRRAKKP